jgi:hypothetical protein
VILGHILLSGQCGCASSALKIERLLCLTLCWQTVDEFVEIMSNLNLPYPKKIDQALPRNLVCGITD